MKNFVENLLIIFGLIFLLGGCSEDFPEREPSYSPDQNSAQVYFPSSNKYEFELSPTESSFTITVSRKNIEGDIKVGLAKIDTANVFTVPEFVDFANGEETAEITIGINNLSVFETYSLELVIEESFTDPYSILDGTSNFKIYVVQSDWENFAVGTYSSEFFGQEWEQILQYSSMLDRYRFADLWSPGYDYEFNWNGDSEISAVDGIVKIETGYVHPTYEMVSVTTNYDESSYDKDSQTFLFVREWTVSAGSFGVFNETFTIQEFY